MSKRRKNLNNIYLGIDLGTTALKACVVCGTTGSILAQDSTRLSVRTVPGGGHEQSSDGILRSARDVIQRLRNALGDDWSTIAGVGVAAQGGSTMIVNKASARPLTRMILWNDMRSSGYSDAVYAQYPPRFWRKLIQCDVAPAGMGRLLWLKERAPELFAECNLHVGAGDFLFHALTGEWRQEAGSAIQIGPYNAANESLDSAPLSLIGVPLSFFPPLRKGHETAPLAARGCRLLGLKADVPVAGPYIDQEAGYLSAHAAITRPLQVSLGTAWVGNFILPDGHRSEAPLQLVLPSPIGKGRFVVMPTRTGNAAWDWALSELIGNGDDEAFAAVARVFRSRLLPPDGLCVIPWLGQPNPMCDAFGGGVIWGLSSQTKQVDLLRAVAAGMCFEFRRVFESLCDDRVVDALVLSGGAAKGNWFRCLFATLFAPLPVYWQKDSDVGAARGSLHVFGTAAARGQLERVNPPPSAMRDQVQRAFSQYRKYFDAAYGGIAAAGTLTIKDTTS
jgi:sugar (pentulose or hexulose) kinase